MPDTQTDVLVAAYRDIETASADFDRLMQVVSAKQAAVQAVGAGAAG